MLDIDNSKNANYFLDRRLNAPVGQFDTLMISKQVINFLLIYFIRTKLSPYVDICWLYICYSIQDIVDVNG